jgi:hypothetical protein
LIERTLGPLSRNAARAHDPQGKDISSHPIAFDLNQYTSLEDRRFSAIGAVVSPFESMN